jgi:hypothetical protein
MWETRGREFSVHLSCHGVGINNPVPPFSSSPVSKVTMTGSDGLDAQGRETDRQMLFESDQGAAGAVGGAAGVVGAEWVLKMVKDGELTSGDFEMEVCFWDQLGLSLIVHFSLVPLIGRLETDETSPACHVDSYGSSDNSPSSCRRQVVTALTQAHTLAGEMAHLELPSSFYSSSLNSSLSLLERSSFVLISQTCGVLPSTLFTMINLRLIHSCLFLECVARGERGSVFRSVGTRRAQLEREGQQRDVGLRAWCVDDGTRGGAGWRSELSVWTLGREPHSANHFQLPGLDCT